MSTRATIKLFDSGVQLYVHCDGYPEGILNNINIVFEKHQHIRLNDDEYGAARFAEAMMREVAPLDETGFGLQKVGSVNDDVEYTYWLTVEDGKPVVYWVHGHRYPTKTSQKHVVGESVPA